VKQMQEFGGKARRSGTDWKKHAYIGGWY